MSLARTGWGLFCLSAASLAFEVILTHLFSVSLQYHFAFLAVSVAILGLGLGAFIGLRLPALKPQVISSWLAQTAAIYATTIPLVVILFSVTGFVPGFVLQALLGALPFLVVGLLTARLYALFTSQANFLYAFDLGGAAFGLLAVLELLNWMSAASVGFVLGALAAVGAFIFAWRSNRQISQDQLIPMAAFGLSAVGLVFNLSYRLVDLPHASLAAIPPDKTMFQILEGSTTRGKLVDSAWGNFARVDLVSGANPDELYAFTNAGAGSYMLRFDGDLTKVKSLTQQVEYLPFVDFSPQKTLILGAGAGKDVLQALLAGSTQITAVEINPAMVAITRKHADFNGNILDRPEVKTVVADGRGYLATSTETYDMIYMNLVYAQAPTPGSSALSEAYMFTTEAFQLYWQHLTPGGRLAIVSHQGLEGTRALITSIKALNIEGLSAGTALKHAALLMYNASDPNQDTSVLILQKSPLDATQSASLMTSAQATGMSPLYLPGIYESLFKGLTSDEITLDQFLVQKDYNLFPTTDNSPFFFNLNPGLPQPLWILLGVSAGVLLIYLLLALTSNSRPTPLQFLFFGALGIGYILIEVPLIQRTILLVGSPTSAMVIVLTTLLLSGGLGSIVSAQWEIKGLWKRLAWTALIISIFAAVLAFTLPVLVGTITHLILPARISVIALLIIPLGLVLGVPFANGLRLVGERNPASLPSLWGWNAVTSVAGSALAASLAVWVGFNIGLMAATACYLLVALAASVQFRQG